MLLLEPRNFPPAGFGSYEFLPLDEPRIRLRIESPFFYGVHMDPSRQPDSSREPWQMFGNRVLWRCPRCARVRTATGDRPEEAWLDEWSYMTTHGLSPSDVWYWQVVCDRCAASFDSP